MSELKCPFCGQEIKIAGEHTTIMSCFNGDCKGSGLYGEAAFWKELIRTRCGTTIGISPEAIDITQVKDAVQYRVEWQEQARPDGLFN